MLSNVIYFSKSYNHTSCNFACNPLAKNAKMSTLTLCDTNVNVFSLSEREMPMKMSMSNEINKRYMHTKSIGRVLAARSRLRSGFTRESLRPRCEGVHVNLYVFVSASDGGMSRAAENKEKDKARLLKDFFKALPVLTRKYL